MLQLEKEKYLFPYRTLLWVSDIWPKSLIYTTHIKKVIAKLYSFTLKSKLTHKNNKSQISQRS